MTLCTFWLTYPTFAAFHTDAICIAWQARTVWPEAGTGHILVINLKQTSQLFFLLLLVLGLSGGSHSLQLSGGKLWGVSSFQITPQLSCGQYWTWVTQDSDIHPCPDDSWLLQRRTCLETCQWVIAASIPFHSGVWRTLKNCCWLTVISWNFSPFSMDRLRRCLWEWFHWFSSPQFLKERLDFIFFHRDPIPNSENCCISSFGGLSCVFIIRNAIDVKFKKKICFLGSCLTSLSLSSLSSHKPWTSVTDLVRCLTVTCFFHLMPIYSGLGNKILFKEIPGNFNGKVRWVKVLKYCFIGQQATVHVNYSVSCSPLPFFLRDPHRLSLLT